MSTPLARCRQSALLFLCVALVLAFLSTTRSAQADGKQGAATAGVLAAESSPSAPTRARTTAKAKPAAHPTKANANAKAKPGPHAAKARPGAVKPPPAKTKPAKAGTKQGPARRGPKLRA